MTRPTTIHRDTEIYALYVGKGCPPMAPKVIKDLFFMELPAVYKAIERGRRFFRSRRRRESPGVP